MVITSHPINRSELARAIGVDRITVWAWERAGKIPAARRVSGKRSEYSPADQLAIRAYAGAMR